MSLLSCRTEEANRVGVMEQMQREAAPTRTANTIDSVCLHWHQFSPHLELCVNSQASPGQDASAEAQRLIISITRMCVEVDAEVP